MDTAEKKKMLHDYVRACFQLSEGNVPGRFVIAAAGPCYLAIGSSRYRRLATIYPLNTHLPPTPTDCETNARCFVYPTCGAVGVEEGRGGS